MKSIVNEGNCIPNPFITEDFVVLNSSQTNLSFCNSTQNYTKIDKTICDQICIKDCSQTYYTMSLNNKYYLTKSDSKIQIKFKSSQDFLYECEVKIDFVTYLSNIGGLISLWFGLSFIDLSSLIESVLDYLKNKLSRLNLQRIIEIFEKYYMKFIMNSLLINLKKLFSFIEKHNLRALLTLLSIPIFLYQNYELVDSYLQFWTIVSVHIIAYRDSDNNYNIRYNALPAITVCNDNLFEELLFNEKIRPDFWHAMNARDFYSYQDDYEEVYKIKHNSYNSYDPYIRNLTDYFTYYGGFLYGTNYFHDYLDVNNRSEFRHNALNFNNKNINGFNFTVTEYNFYEKIYECQLITDFIIKNNTLIKTMNAEEKDILNVCGKWMKTLKILSPFGKCLTYLHKFKEIDFEIDLNQYFLQLQEKVPDNYHENKFKPSFQYFIIHSQDMLPILTDSDLYLTETTVNMRKGFLIKLKKYEFQRLRKPYDTNCQKYGNSTRFQCLNECYFDGYMNSDIKCIPNSESLYTFEINGEIENRRKIFCKSDDENSIKSINIFLREKCNKKCLYSCVDTYFSSEYEEIQSGAGRVIRFILRDTYYRQIKYTPKMTFFMLVIQIANTWSLWHGISFKQLFEYIIKSLKLDKVIENFGRISKKIFIQIRKHINIQVKYIFFK